MGPPHQTPHHNRRVTEKADVKAAEVGNYRKAEEGDGNRRVEQQGHCAMTARCHGRSQCAGSVLGRYLKAFLPVHHLGGALAHLHLTPVATPSVRFDLQCASTTGRKVISRKWTLSPDAAAPEYRSG